MSNQLIGSLFIVAAPSGGGKTSLVKQLVNNVPDMAVSISHTTRDIRPTEKDAVDYFFIDEDQFQHMICQQEFVEYAYVYNHFYGTSIAQIQSHLQAGRDVVLDIDWQGAAQIKATFSQAISIFILPPSLEILKRRLMDRQRDGEDVIEQRMQQAHSEMSHYVDFDYLIINDDFEQAAFELQAIIIAHRLRIARQTVKMRKLLSFLTIST